MHWNNIIITNVEAVKTNLEENVKESECSLKQEIQSTAVSMRDDLESLSEKINTKVVQVNETIEKEWCSQKYSDFLCNPWGKCPIKPSKE